MKIILMCHAERHKDNSKMRAEGTPLDPKDPTTLNWWNGLTPSDKKAELTTLNEAGESQAAFAGEKLGVVPDLYLTSKSTHAWQTAQLLALKNPSPDPVRLLSLWALTPGGEVPGLPPLSLFNLTFDYITSELAALCPVPVKLRGIYAAVIVGHHPRVPQLFGDMTRNRGSTKLPADFTGPAWPKARGAFLEGSYNDFEVGKARVVRWI